MPTWDPTQYERFGDHRTRPFLDLIARVGAEEPQRVVDLGCGNGPATLLLAERWPTAQITGVDSSSEMLERARRLDVDHRVEWVQSDVRDVDLAQPAAPDVVVTNATLQWVPEHRELMTRWLQMIAPGGWFAMQVPGNFDAPSHRVIREVVAQQPDGERLLAEYRMTDPVDDPGEYVDLVAPHVDHVDAWETTYLQVLDPQGQQADPVLEWVRGTALRPVLDLLDQPGQERLLRELAPRLAEAYPRREYGVPFPFRRVFLVARTKEA